MVITPKEKCNGFGFSGAARYLKANSNTKNGPHEGCVHEVGHDWLYNDERGTKYRILDNSFRKLYSVRPKKLLL